MQLRTQNVGKRDTKEEVLYIERKLTECRNGEREVQRAVCRSRKLPKTGNFRNQHKWYVPYAVALKKLADWLKSLPGETVTCNATLRRVRETTLAVEKHVFLLYVCSLRYPACKSHVPYYTAICSLSGCTTFFPHYLISGTILRKSYAK
jgi:hypothetical protein